MKNTLRSRRCDFRITLSTWGRFDSFNNAYRNSFGFSLNVWRATMGTRHIPAGASVGCFRCGHMESAKGS